MIGNTVNVHRLSVIRLAARLIDALVGMRPEEVALGLEQVRGETVVAVAVEVGQGRGHGRDRDPVGHGGRVVRHRVV